MMRRAAAACLSAGTTSRTLLKNELMQSASIIIDAPSSSSQLSLLALRAASNAAASSSSSATASVTVPSYEIETFHARLRRGSGSLDAAKLRKSGRVPATVVGLPGGKTLTLSLPTSEVEAALRSHGGRRGIGARMFDVRVKAAAEAAAEASGVGVLEFLGLQNDASSSSSSSSPAANKNPFFTLRVLPRQVHRGMVSGEVENVNFLLCPRSSSDDERSRPAPSTTTEAAAAAAEAKKKSITVRVPIVVLGAATAPGVKRGGFLNLIRRDVRLRCEVGSSNETSSSSSSSSSPSSSSSSSPIVIPRSIEVDASHLELGERVALRSLALPPGVFLDEEHLDLPVLKVAGRQSRD